MGLQYSAISFAFPPYPLLSLCVVQTYPCHLIRFQNTYYLFSGLILLSNISTITLSLFLGLLKLVLARCSASTLGSCQLSLPPYNSKSPRYLHSQELQSHLQTRKVALPQETPTVIRYCSRYYKVPVPESWSTPAVTSISTPSIFIFLLVHHDVN